MAAQYIYTMKGLGKVYPPDQTVLKDIWLSFLPGAKIGVLGLNGAGKSTLLKIMAGVDKEFLGEAYPADGVEHRLPAAGARARPVEDRARQRRGRGRRHQGAPDPLRRGEREARRAARARRDGEGPRGARQAAGPHRRRRGLGAGLEARAGDGRPALPAARRRRPHPVGRRAAPRRALPAAPAVARPAAARRAHQPPRRRVGGVARALPEGLPRHGRRRHPRPLFPRQRRGLDPGARSRLGHSVAGQLLVLARAEAEAARDRGEAGEPRRQRTLQRELDWIRMSPRARQAKGKARLNAYEAMLGGGVGAAHRDRPRSTSRRARGWATSSSRRGASARATATCSSWTM